MPPAELLPLGESDSLVYFGGDVKALGSGRVAGYVVRFGSPDTADVQGDFFAASTDYGLDLSTKARVVYHHGLTRRLGPTRLGVVDLSPRVDGIWAEGTLATDRAEVKAVYDQVEAGTLGWSSGSVDRLVDRKAVSGKSLITSWPLIEVSLTPRPVDPRNRALALKSLLAELGPVAGPSLVERSERLVADATEILGLYRKAADQRHAEGRFLSPAKRAALKALADDLAALAVVPQPQADPERLRALKLRLLAGRL